MATVVLKDIASVQLGHSFRAGVSPHRDGSVRVVQMRDLRSDGIVDLKSPDRVEIAPPDHQWLRRGDILVRSRGDSVSSAIVDAQADRVVAAAPLLVIRVTSQLVLPHYLNWFINQRPSQGYFAKNMEGSNVKMISRGALESLPLDLPSLDRQQTLVELAGLAAREKQLVTTIGIRRDDMLARVMLDYAKEGTAR